MAGPRFSIVVPCLNAERYLGRSLESVAAQDYANSEVIVVDGGSHDGTLKEAARWSTLVTKVISEKDDGQFHAIMKGFDVATGEVFAFMNADDEYAPGTFRSVCRIFEEYGQDCLVSGAMEVIDGDGRVLRTVPCIPFVLKYMLVGGCHVPSQATFFGVEVWRRVKPLLRSEDVKAIHFAMEWLLLGLCAELADHRVCRQDVYGRFRLHPGTKTMQLAGRSVRRLDDGINRESRRIIDYFVLNGYTSRPSMCDAVFAVTRKVGYLLLHGAISEVLMHCRENLWKVRYIARNCGRGDRT